MNTIAAEITENGIHYTLRGDYYFPDLIPEEEAHQLIGKYGLLRLKYLQKHRPGLYTRLLLSGKLYDHLQEIDEIAHNRLSQMTAQMTATEGITERMKATDQMAWVARMNSIRTRAEEIIFAELIYD
jgi:hypothetical protein